jgi:hypothetical protein
MNKYAGKKGWGRDCTLIGRWSLMLFLRDLWMSFLAPAFSYKKLRMNMKLVNVMCDIGTVKCLKFGNRLFYNEKKIYRAI